MAKTFTAPIIPIVIAYSFDDEIPVYLCGSDEKAETVLWEDFTEELRVEKEENERIEGEDLLVSISDDHRYASITIVNKDGSRDVTEWHIGTVYNDR